MYLASASIVTFSVTQHNLSSSVMRKYSLVIFLLIFDTISGQILHLEPQNSTSKLSTFTCDAINGFYDENSFTGHTVAIAQLRNNFPSGFFDDLYNCVSPDISMVSMDLSNGKTMTMDLRYVQFAVIIADDIDKVSFIGQD